MISVLRSGLPSVLMDFTHLYWVIGKDLETAMVHLRFVQKILKSFMQSFYIQ